MNIQIRPTTFETRQEFASLLDEANTWQKARGSQGWTGVFDDDWMLPRIDRGELYLVYMVGEPVSAFRILYEDRAFWGEREVGDSIYLHTFAVRRSKAGLGIGNAVIEMVVSMGRKRSLAKVRLDCFLANTRLISFYERNGFSSVGTTVVNGKMLNLMERVIGSPTDIS
jgi:ribosomal protein S18 acetylase RimI-like enzyme